MNNLHSAFFILLLLQLPTQECYSQIIPEADQIFGYKKTSLLFSDVSSVKDSVKKKSSEKSAFTMQKSPFKAVLYSAILPGAGQFYNESYWKIPVIAGLGGYFVYELVRNNNLYLDYRQDYLNSQTPENPSGNQQFLNLREFYRDQRDNFIVYSLILYVVNLVDAYVDAQLYDFNVSDKLKIGVLKKDKLLNLSYGF